MSTVRLTSVQTSDASFTSTINSSVTSKLLPYLPILRFTTLTIVLVAIDSLLSISLWIAGGNSAYLEDSVEDFSLYHSTFDLAVIAAIRGIVLICCLYYLEHYTMMAVSSKLQQTQLTSRRLAWLCHVIILILPFITMIYAIVKLLLIFIESTNSFSELHIAYKILCVLGVVTPGMELVFGLMSFYFMWRLVHVLRLRLVLQNENEDKPKEKGADIKRLMILAIPVSHLTIITIMI